ncbi:hypothetical protein BS50DRAFT_608518 [Corynespora cassiicola Philippines]|uniref:Exonuclease domain-containing protein n=1 Tax=Corynespora cassiicola Philippines TaxID=1448308 RepID=A0A2T2NXA8_CORCC|nr:hypothetical protein BS50DRAFT_608518 [Corynespora cassiicola Philippines]
MAAIKNSVGYLAELRSLVEHEDVLKKYGYTTQQLSEEELLLKRRCIGCNKTLSQLGAKASKAKLTERQPKTTGNADSRAAGSTPPRRQSTIVSLVPTSSMGVAEATESPSTEEPQDVNKFRCKYHVGAVVNRYWTCCSQHVSAKPCGGADAHVTGNQALHELAALYQLHATPIPVGSPWHSDIRDAVAIDCEMGTAKSGDSELIRVTVVDYFSGKVLVDSLVNPDVPMEHLNTRYSGVSWADLSKAKRKGTCLRGKDQARLRVWNFVGPQTIVVGHATFNDLRALRWIHANVVDSQIIASKAKKTKDDEKRAEKERVMKEPHIGGIAMEDSQPQDQASGQALLPSGLTNMLGVSKQAISQGNTPKPKKAKGSGDLSLKTLIKKRVGRDIQTGGRAGHDSLEDAIAARDLVHWHVTHPNFEWE